ncbi:winged helix DNA-binding protein [Terrarubrum flagellatum]|uniref:winged helix DNA-binding protein n=1 Tax=Terrirubrum flagellatum TaxID=2895980 RepID=UPI0031451AFA
MKANRTDELGAGEAVPQSPASRRLSGFEYQLMTLMFGFQRWVENCMAAADVHGLGALDILVLHAVNHRARGRRLTDICMVLNIDDGYLISYALKKLLAAGLIIAERKGRERHFSTTEEGDRACFAYRGAREAFLVQPFFIGETGQGELDAVAAFLSQMTSTYDQAGRNATVATLDRPKAPPLRTKK